MRKWSQPAQRNRTGQAPPPAFTLDGSPQVPYGTATAPIAYRACSLSSSVAASRHRRLPCRSNCIAVTLSTAWRRRVSPTRKYRFVASMDV